MRRTLLFVVVAGSGFLGFAAHSDGAEATTRTGQTGAPQAIAQLEDVGMIPGDARYLRDNRDPGQIVGGVVSGVGALRDQTGQMGQTGRTMQGMQGFQGTTRGFGTTGGFNQFGNMGGFGGFGQMGRMFGGAMNTRNARTRQNLRTSVELGFTAPPVQTPTAVGVRVQERIGRISQIQEMGSVAIEMDGRTAVLRGQVATEQDRDLVARMLLLEPGISDVRNELTFAPRDDPAAQP
jgi:hypothetical protein